MYIFIETSDLTMVKEFSTYLNFFPSIREVEEVVLGDKQICGPGIYFGSHLFDRNSKSYRLLMAKFGAVGSIMFSDSPESMLCPIYAGKIPEKRQMKSASLVSNYAITRSTVAQSFGVKVLGQTYSDPRNVLVLDNRKIFEDEASEFLNLCPDDWWHDLSIVTTSNSNNYRKFFEYFCYSVPLAYSRGAKAKLNHFSVPFCELPLPTTSSEYGTNVRVLANKRSNELYLSDTPS